MSVASHAIGGSTTKRKIDDRVKFLIDHAAEQRHRSIFLVVGDRAKDQVVNLHMLVSRATHSSKVSVLWCMKSDPDFGSTSKKRLERQGRLEVKAGMSSDATKENFQTWLSQTEIRFCHYKESHKILGNTFGMVVLQDFEALTPNIMARTMETVAGGGCIVFMLRALKSLKQLYSMTMDIHSRYRTESLRDVVPRFNERFLLSLAECDNVLCIDDDFNVLPFTTKMQQMGKHREKQDQQLRLEGRLKHEAELAALKSKLRESEVGPLVQTCYTIDQAKVLLSLMQVVMEKTLNSTCAVTAARGRGKSASLGLAVAGAVQQGYSNILVTAPAPDNLQTFFEFVVKGLQELGYTDRVDFEVMQSTNPEFAKCIVRINVFKGHRQTVQFVSANDSSKFAQAELLVIDEAAALPLPLVQKMLGPYLIFISSTIAGYEGTGRSLSMKLVADMRKHSKVGGVGTGESGSSVALGGGGGSASAGRALKELKLEDPIRYAPGDPVERWLNTLLCLEATSRTVALKAIPHPQKCDLYYVNRDALFSFHKKAEAFLQNIVSLLVSAHYKNQPNDLQLMSDAPGHHVFVLCAPVASADELPDVLCVIHVCEEGNVSSASLASNMSKGTRPSGDLIPYTLAQQFFEEGFAQLHGIRVVRIATNPELQRSGYGSRALNLLMEYYRGNINVTPASPDGNGEQQQQQQGRNDAGDDGDAMLHVRKTIPTLLQRIDERPYEPVDYVGTSYGITTELFGFWKKAGFDALYVRQQPNDLTGEHSCVMINPIGYNVSPLRREFHRRFMSLLAFSFRGMSTELALSVVMDVAVHVPQKLAELTAFDEATQRWTVDGIVQANYEDVLQIIPAVDLQRLRMYSTSFIDMGVILDVVPQVAKLYFGKQIFKKPDGTDGVVLPHAQAAVLLAIGLQCATFESIGEFKIFSGVPLQQLRAFFSKALTRIVEHIDALAKASPSVEGEEGASEKRKRDADAEGESETIRYDAQGNIVGLSVVKTVAKQTSRDQTLFRDARTAAVETRGGDSRKSSGGLSKKRAKKN